ncbi:sigma-70 family RNA polymerase sigma factor [Psychromonas arctica]|uniref:sigma-70 family RNA polymerase sigma factor n=1 Tax=Psychromonas arctica TaxID=168275 RepID=UPI00042111B3|nr:sigma-70 family RNA polymerase sigma factor [Psychromonas arctica]
MTGIADEILMLQYAQGDVQAFSELYFRHKNSLYRYFLRQTATPELAEELYQDVWNKLIEASPSYQAESKFSTWLYRIAHNELIDHYRRHASEKKVFLASIEQVQEKGQAHSVRHHCNREVHNNDNDEQGVEDVKAGFLADKNQPNVDDELESKQQAVQLKWCLQQLPREQKEAFLLKHESGFTLNEIAQLVGETSENIKSRIRYSINKLKHCVKHNMGKFYE